MFTRLNNESVNTLQFTLSNYKKIKIKKNKLFIKKWFTVYTFVDSPCYH